MMRKRSAEPGAVALSLGFRGQMPSRTRQARSWGRGQPPPALWSMSYYPVLATRFMGSGLAIMVRRRIGGFRNPLQSFAVPFPMKS